MTDLIAELELAMGGSRALDKLIWLRLGMSHPDKWRKSPPRYTEHPHHALTLLPSGWRWVLCSPHPASAGDKTKYFARMESPDYKAVSWEAGDKISHDVVRGKDADGFGANPALALCIAAMKARVAAPHPPAPWRLDMEWMPIESAPDVDGMEANLFVPGYGVFGAVWDVATGDWWRISRYEPDDPDFDPMIIQSVGVDLNLDPTHWQPLPAPPAEDRA